VTRRLPASVAVALPCHHEEHVLKNQCCLKIKRYTFVDFHLSAFLFIHWFGLLCTLDSSIQTKMSSQEGRENGHVNGDSESNKESNGPQISDEHREYLISRHGTADLDPLPSMDIADPHNWPGWKV
jgi:hypothetical protein